MKFLCRNCKAKYQIADEKVAGRTLRMTCQQCGESIVVRGPARQAQAAVSARPAPPAPISVPAASSTLFGADLTQQLAPSARPRPEASVPDEWHVAINDAPVGPLSRDDVARKIAQGALDRESLAWRDGMDDWLAIKHISDLASLFSAPAKNSQSHGRHAGPSVRPPAGRSDLSPLAAAPTSVESPAASGSVAQAAERAEPHPSAPAFDASAVAAQPSAEDTDSLEVAEEAAPSREVSVAAAIAGPIVSASSGAAATPAPTTTAPAPATSAPPPAAARRRGWAQWFVVGSAAVFMLAFGALLGVRFLAPSNAPPPTEAVVVAPPTSRPAPKPNPEPEPRAAAERADDEDTSQIELDPQAVDGAKTARKSVSPPRQVPAPPTPSAAAEKKRPALSVEDKALLDKMRGDLDHGPTNLRVGNESARAQAASGTGQLTAEQLSQVVLNGRKNLQRCYETALRGANTNETVRLDVDIQVSPSGNVTSVRTSGKGLPGMDECIVHTVQMWRFPMSAETTQTRFPVVFQPGA